MRVLVLMGITVGWSLASCGGASQPASPESPADEAAPAAEESAEPAAQSSEGGAETEADQGLPTACADASAQYCTPTKSFAKRLCEGDFPTVALSMFSSNAPWTKAYLGRKTKAWSASGAGSSNEELPRDEEVVVLMHRGPPDLGGIQVSGASGGFEVLRWNGNCVTLQEGELLFDAPPRPKMARIVWKRIEMDTRDVLREDEKVNDAYIYHRKHCKGVSMGKVSLECVKADKKLGQAIADYVRGGGKLGTPNNRP
ncbi:MAG: hypothetical protein JRI23_08545 [Deltaproteobacteria bacterium]|jgi:hypothetical protein|nr:hypothetical protein [Deltaproteobacteria bacterium]MBW2531662.1 hypothetical protein [Deltaproteobacteria bacterium]